VQAVVIYWPVNNSGQLVVVQGRDRTTGAKMATANIPQEDKTDCCNAKCLGESQTFPKWAQTIPE